MSATCNVRQLQGVHRCELEPGHSGNHRANLEWWPNLSDPETRRTRQANQGRSRPLARTSEKQALLEAKWAGIKEAFIFLAQRYETDGRPHCEECGRAAPASEFDLHHIRRRGQGGEYAARNAALVCRPCHQRLSGEPMWSRA